jgi:hypothetical protein
MATLKLKTGSVLPANTVKTAAIGLPSGKMVGLIQSTNRSIISNNGGYSWREGGLLPVSGSRYCIAYIPSINRIITTPNTAATSVAYSDDDGETWFAGGTLTNNHGHRNIIVTSTERIIVYSYGTNTTTYSDNGGLTWIAGGNMTNTGYHNEGVVTNSGRIVIPSGNGATTSTYSIDNGASWVAGGTLTNSNDHYITIYIPSLDRIVVPSHSANTVTYSNDGGETWIAGGNMTNSHAHYSGVLTSTGRIVIPSSGQTTSTYSDNGGISWTAGGALNDNTTHFASAISSNGRISVLSNNNPSVSEDNGVSWRTSITDEYTLVDSCPKPRIAFGGILPKVDIGGQPIYSSVITNAGTIIVKGATTTFRRSTDNGLTWSTVTGGPSDSTYILLKTATGRILSIGVTSKIQAWSDDDGLTWTSQTDSGKNIGTINKTAGIVTSTGRIIVSSYNSSGGETWISDDNGVTFTASGALPTVGGARKNLGRVGTTIYTSSSGSYVLNASTNNGTSWASVASSGHSVGAGYFIETLTGRLLYPISNNSTSYCACKYTDNGTTWVSTTNGPAIATGCGICAPNGRCIQFGSGTNRTLYSDDNGVTWYYGPLLPIVLSSGSGTIGSGWSRPLVTPTGRIIVFGGNTTAIAYSDNNGDSWQSGPAVYVPLFKKDIDYFKVEGTTLTDIAPDYVKIGGAKDLEFSYDKETWFTGATTNGALNGINNRAVYIRGTGRTVMSSTSSTTSPTFTIYGTDVVLSGDIGTLLDWRNPPSTIGANCFHNFFYQQTCIIDASDLRLSAKIIGNGAYSRMFYQCNQMVHGPHIMVNVVPDTSCENMFYSCSLLSSLEVDFTDWNIAGYGTTNWTTLVNTTGTLICPSELDTTTRNNSTIPSGWTVVVK